MLTYHDASRLFSTARCPDKGKPIGRGKHTRLFKRGDAYAVRLHDTDVVTIRPTEWELDSGGWFTAATKERFNEYSPARVYSVRGLWLLHGANGVLCRYVDGLCVDASGYPLNADDLGACVPGDDIIGLKTAAQLSRRISAYIRGYLENLTKNSGIDADNRPRIPEPSPGDCFGCQFVPQGKARAPGNGDFWGIEHLLLHLLESYYVPSLLWRAFRERPLGMGAHAMWALTAENAVRNQSLWIARNALRHYFRVRKPALLSYILAHGWPKLDN